MIWPFGALQKRRQAFAKLFENPNFPPTWPYSGKDFDRLDNSPDELFYAEPRLVTHIDDDAIAALKSFYAETLRDDTDLLDLCSSWISHLPERYRPREVVGLGMNESELKRNRQLHRWVVQNLNQDPKLPFADNAFDYVTCVVSVDYLIKPLEIFREIHRVLRPGGMAIISQSNRCFMQKVIAIWLSTNDLEHAYIIGSYFHYAGGFENLQARDISRGRGDPMFVVTATKQKM
jgi:SAM-dependent methyltransferase